MTQQAVRVRLAPSPTGSLHIGNARTALFNWLFARANHGSFILRIEDTDQSRFVEGALEEIMDGLRWLGLDWDEGPEKGGDFGPYVQSERLDKYQEWANWLVDHGKAYRDYSTPEEMEAARQQSIAANGGKMPRPGYERIHRFLTDDERAKFAAERNSYVIRLAMPLEGDTVAQDIIHGELRFPNSDLSDIVLLKSDGFPTYHLAMAVDDHFMQISHVIRGDEWISSLPMHQTLYDYFGWDAPKFVHLPLMTYQGKKLSKRNPPTTDQGDPIPIFVREYQAAGYEPEAVVNWLATMGWSFGDDIEIFSMQDAMQRFTLERISHSPTDMTYDKLAHFNGTYIRNMPLNRLADRVRPILQDAYGDIDEDALQIILPHVQERINPVQAVVPLLQFLFGTDFETPNAEQLIQKKMDAAGTKQILARVYATLDSLPDFEASTQESALRALVEELDFKVGQVFNTVRWATTAQQVSPPLFESMQALGKSTTLTRLQAALDQFE